MRFYVNKYYWVFLFGALMMYQNSGGESYRRLHVGFLCFWVKINMGMVKSISWEELKEMSKPHSSRLKEN